MKPIVFIFLIVIFLSSCETLSETMIIETLIPSSTLSPNFSSTESFSPLPTSSITPIPASASPLPTQLTIVPTLNPTQVIQQEEIKKVIQEYFDIHYQALSTSPPEDFQETGFGDLLSELPEAKDFEAIEKAKLEVQAKYWEIKHLRYVEYQHSLDYDDIVVDSATNMAKAFLLDRADVVRERSMEYNPEDPRITYREFRHIFVLHNEKGEWKIVSDIYLDSWWQQFRKPGSTTEEILNAIELLMNKLETMPSPTPQT